MKKETIFSLINDEITRRKEEGEPLDSRKIAESVPMDLVDKEAFAFNYLHHYTRVILNIRGCKSIGEGIFFDIDTGTLAELCEMHERGMASARGVNYAVVKLGEQIDQLSMTDLSGKLIERGEKYKTIGELIGFLEKLA